MSYIEIKKVKDTEYASFVKKFSFMGKNFRIKEHIGKNISTLDSKDYLKNNFDKISSKELDSRKGILDNLDLVPSLYTLPVCGAQNTPHLGFWVVSCLYS